MLCILPIKVLKLIDASPISSLLVISNLLVRSPSPSEISLRFAFNLLIGMDIVFAKKTEEK